MTTAEHDCAAIREQLIDLLYDELDEREAAELRSAADGCAGCADQLARLQEGLSLAAALPLAAPSAGFEQRVMALAHQELAGAPAVTKAEQRPSALSRLAGRLRSLVAGPQVAMATLTLLVAALGVWYLPRQRQPVGVGGDTVVSLEPDGEAVATAPAPPARSQAPSAPAAPSARRSRGSAPAAASANVAHGASMAAAPAGGIGLEAWRPEGSDHTPAAAADAPVAEPSGPADVLGGSAPMREGETAQRAHSEATQSNATRATSAGAGAVDQRRLAAAEAQGRAESLEAPAAQQPALGMAARPAAAPTRRRARSATMASNSAPRASALDDVMADGAGTQQRALGDRQTYERGLRRYRARDYRGAIDELDRVVTAPSPDARTLVPSALHHIAQSLRASGSCGPAVTRYESLLRRFPGYAQAPRAMMEAADCYRRIGRLSAARRWATRAQSYGATAAAARRELLRLDSMESGSGRSRRRPSRAAPANAAAAVEEAY